MYKKTVLATLMACAFMTQAASASETRNVSYLTSWGLPEVNTLTDQLKKSDIDVFMLSFGQWDNAGNITVSDKMASIPVYNAYWLDQGYIGWTQLKHERPEKKVVIAFGGQSYESIWSAIQTPVQRENVAKNLAQLLQTPFPVYKKNLPKDQLYNGECLQTDWQGNCDLSTYQLAGNVYLDGIDFDFEKAARLTQQENDNLLDLAKRVRALVGTEKLLSLTTYHVGADPENCANPAVFENCSYVENSRSSHHGEVTQLLKDSKDVFDFFNVMTYDAGTNFNYKVAMQNYAEAVGDKGKVLVGATINKQWAPDENFVESKANNLERAAWQAENGYGGFFAWALGSSTEQMSFADQVSYLNEMVKVANDTPLAKPAEPANPVEPTQPSDPIVTLDRAIPDVSKGPVLSYSDYGNGGEINLFTSAENYKGSWYKVYVNGKYAFEFNKNKAYYSYITDLNSNVKMLTKIPDVALKEGDVITLMSSEAKTPAQTLVVGKVGDYSADQGVTSVDTNGKEIFVTLDAKYFNQPNRYKVLINGKYVMETFAGKHYYSYIKKNDANVTVRNATETKKGDKVEVIRVAGTPGMTKAPFKTVYTHIVK